MKDVSTNTVQSKPALPTLQEFMDVVFHTMDPEKEMTYTGAKKGKMPGSTLKKLARSGSGQYFLTASLTLGAPNRQAGSIEKIYVIVLDDINDPTKTGDEHVPPNDLAPTYKIMSSEGSEQWGYVFKAPVSPMECAQLMRRVDASKARLTDPGAMKNPDRLARLPNGTNGKELDDGTYNDFKVRLMEIHPGRVFTIDELAEAWALPEYSSDMVRSTSGGWDWAVPPMTVKDIDHWGPLSHFDVIEVHEGKVYIHCPNEHNHRSPTKKSDAAILISEDGNWAYNCFHAHCDPKVFDFQKWYRKQAFAALPAPSEGDAPPAIVSGVVLHAAKVQESATTGKALTVTPEGLEAEHEGCYVLPNDHMPIDITAPVIFKHLARSKKIFTRGGAVVELRRGSLSPITASEFRSRLPEYGKPLEAYFSYKGVKMLKPKECAADKANMLLSCSAAHQHLPEIVRVVNYPPLVLVDGEARLLSRGWHDVNGGIYVMHHRDIDTVPVKVAVSRLRALLCDFHFASDADMSRAVAMMINPALTIGGFLGLEPHPIDIAEADKSQTGKGVLQKLVRGIYGERAHIITKKMGGVGSFDESIAGGILSGNVFVVIDNARGKINSQIWEAAVTAGGDTVGVRVPHQGEVQVNPSGICWQLTSNGVEVTEDTANRACITRLVKHENDYRWHQWPEGGLEMHIKTHQGFYLGCVHAVIREWVAAGMPLEGVANAPGHDMHVWARAVDWIVQRVFGLVNPMEGHFEKQRQVSTPQLKWAREFCIAVNEVGELGNAFTAMEIATLCDEEDISWPNRNSYESEGVAATAVGRIMRTVFRDATGDEMIIDRFTLGREKETYYATASRQHKKRWVYFVEELQGR